MFVSHCELYILVAFGPPSELLISDYYQTYVPLSLRVNGVYDLILVSCECPFSWPKSDETKNFTISLFSTAKSLRPLCTKHALLDITCGVTQSITNAESPCEVKTWLLSWF